MSLKIVTIYNLSRKIVHNILSYSVPLGSPSFLYPLSLFINEKGLTLIGGVATFGDVLGILYSPRLLSRL
jgi:hypothetical protein